MRLRLAAMIAMALFCARVAGQNIRIDPAFSIEADGPVLAVGIQPDGKILIGGSFTTINGLTRHALQRERLCRNSTPLPPS